MMEKIKTYEEYKNKIEEIDRLIDDCDNRNDMIIFHAYICLKNDLRNLYQEFESKRIKEYGNKIN